MNTSTLKTKIKELLGSIRFWIVTLTAVVAVLEAVAGGGTTLDILEIVKIYLASVVGIGTLDSVAMKVGATKK